ncbi:DNA polymerase III, epsilon chain [Pectobacterium atrosepticum SCRI1043]|uniref:DNA polymerase III subunit epsilon n=1 Tax=Pectobacterium atrosepticum (strain SCRI 1043 / ATCC BAA-672) TaxID=218491 RepID=Q6D1V8_PECAS|nr:DNA polymerase III subunit epsilon [Pectobacterium atrosepticum]GKV84694.1 DNA polymerase III subunit epsilon [Pectobacterium carotovorum subsp. carotovorum]AIA72159.1 DNA polymerase III subunit epsilon [Pectobacterium atrosepticum]AIK15127.1 DNA polymerase III, epsilon chain [Pectobacterium atrosepticum]ATY91897.1 DNA polymerase III subunit epsilon [Pectobacterium atrosepticum]KFX15248.1 DNA polymerase III subunit epsilon [Pectobacterium atrosepticum]
MSTEITRQIVLDTETTGMNKLGVHYEGHKIIEIGAVEVINRRLTGRHFHVYIKPDRLVDPEAYNIHGISDEFLADKPTYADVADDFLDFIRGAELVIHNATFDIGFMDYEFRLLNRNIPKTETFCKITDSLFMARKIFPGKRNNLDALCDRYLIDNSKRTLHGALLDAEILAEVYLAMTGGQTSLTFSMEGEAQRQNESNETIQRIVRPQSALKVLYADETELLAHEQRLDLVAKKGGSCLWRTE